MPESENEKAPPSLPKPALHPKELSSEYHKAHKQLMLWSTILLIWELIGVDLSKAKDAGGNIGPIVTDLKSPQAVPWALTGLVIYFLFKCSVEWAQCHVERRKLRFARVDFISAWIVALAALGLYVGQALSRAQLANTIQESKGAQSVMAGFAIGIVLVMSGRIVWISKSILPKSKQAMLSLVLFGLAGVLAVSALIWSKPIVWRYVLYGLCFAMIAGVSLMLLFIRATTKDRDSQKAIPLPKKSP
jgi:hypothetical protein